VSIIRGVKLYQYDIWCMSPCVDGRLHTRRPSTQSDIHQMSY